MSDPLTHKFCNATGSAPSCIEYFLPSILFLTHNLLNKNKMKINSDHFKVESTN